MIRLRFIVASFQKADLQDFCEESGQSCFGTPDVLVHHEAHSAATPQLKLGLSPAKMQSMS
jgi:hypothetical protein